MRVKLFVAEDVFGGFWRRAGNARRLEDEMGAWLGQNPGVQVRFIKQTVAGGIFSPRALITVWYDDPPG